MAAERKAAQAAPPPRVGLESLRTTVPGAGRAWALPPPPMRRLNANDTFPSHAVKASVVKALRTAARHAAEGAGVPRLEAAHVFYVVHLHQRAHRADPGNWAPTAKAALDGVVDAGVLPDDDWRRVAGPDPRAGERVSLRGGRLTLVLRKRLGSARLEGGNSNLCSPVKGPGAGRCTWLRRPDGR